MGCRVLASQHEQHVGLLRAQLICGMDEDNVDVLCAVKPTWFFIVTDLVVLTAVAFARPPFASSGNLIVRHQETAFVWAVGGG